MQVVAQERQLLTTNPPDILVCTPGRLAEHVLGRGGRHSVLIGGWKGRIWSLWSLSYLIC